MTDEVSDGIDNKAELSVEDKSDPVGIKLSEWVGARRGLFDLIALGVGTSAATVIALRQTSIMETQNALVKQQYKTEAVTSQPVFYVENFVPYVRPNDIPGSGASSLTIGRDGGWSRTLNVDIATDIGFWYETRSGETISVRAGINAYFNEPRVEYWDENIPESWHFEMRQQVDLYLDDLEKVLKEEHGISGLTYWFQYILIVTYEDAMGEFQHRNYEVVNVGFPESLWAVRSPRQDGVSWHIYDNEIVGTENLEVRVHDEPHSPFWNQNIRDVSEVLAHWYEKTEPSD